MNLKQQTYVILAIMLEAVKAIFGEPVLPCFVSGESL